MNLKAADVVAKERDNINRNNGQLAGRKITSFSGNDTEFE